MTCTGGDLGLLIGQHGQTIDSLQYLANCDRPSRGLGDLRHDRRRGLPRPPPCRRSRGLRVRAAERGAAGERVALEPMTAIERKVVHERLKDVDGVATLSEGTEPNRHIVVFPA